MKIWRQLLKISIIGLTVIAVSCKDDDIDNQQPIDLSLSCNGKTTFPDARDGQKYKIIKIGNQCWMAENLNYKSGGSWCYDNDPKNCEVYGRLYDWKSALKSCPDNWHLPSVEEWEEMIEFLGGSSVAGEKSKSTTGWAVSDIIATNSSGFSGLPGGGYEGMADTFLTIGEAGYWWSSTEDLAPFNSFVFGMFYDEVDFEEGESDKINGLSCRCIKD